VPLVEPSGLWFNRTVKRSTLTLAGVVVFVGFTGCSSAGRKPSSDSGDLKAQAQTALSFVSGPAFTDQACPAYLKDLSAQMRTISWDSYTNAQLDAVASDTMNLLWQVRSTLHQKLGSVGSACALQMRDTFHAIRDVEDYLGEFAYHLPAIDPSTLNYQSQPIPIYDQSAYPPYFAADSIAGKPFHFQSGDVMIARGVSFVSAIISKVSDNQSQYSHNVFVDVDPKTGKESTIESYIAVGVEQYDMDYALRNENARLLVLRPKNTALGAQAAELLLAKTLAGDGHGGNIPYDYSLNFVDHSKMSCTEVVRAAYEWASNGKLILPTYPALIPDKNPQFLKALTINSGPTYTPDDIEIDPTFDMILDWRDYRVIRDSRYKDAILNSIMSWIYDQQYNFQQTNESLIAGNIVLPSRSTALWPLIQKMTGSPDLDSTMPKSMLEAMTVLNQIGATLLDKVRQQDQTYISAHQRPMTNQQLLAYLESLRAQDESDYKNFGYSIFHYALRPDNLRIKRQPNH
jgi:hypothetical protein